MKNRSAYFLVVIIITSNNLFAQQWEKSIKLYNQNTFYHEQVSTYPPPSEISETRFNKIEYLKPTVAFRWASDKTHWAHEAELTTLSWTKSDLVHKADRQDGTKEVIGGTHENYGSIVCRYDARYQINIKKASKFTIELGAGGQPFYYWHAVNPKVSNSFPTKFFYTGINALIVPGVAYAISKKCYLNLNVPINLLTLSVTNQIVRNSAFTANQQRTTTFDLSSFDSNIQLRLGLGIKI